MNRIILLSLCLLAFVGANSAAEPPDLVSYQGVLRNANDRPLNGDFDVVFRFFNAETAGDEILIDRHTTADSEPVTATRGLFSITLGGGAVSDGAGPGTYVSLSEVFRDHGDLWIEVEIDLEVLTPRIRVASAGYALNADHLDGRDSAGFVDTSSTSQTKQGGLIVMGTSSPNGYGVEGFGTTAGGYFEDTYQSGNARVGFGDYGVYAQGGFAGGYFAGGASGYAYVGRADTGIEAYGYGETGAGGRFENNFFGTLTWIALRDRGVEASGPGGGGYFLDSNGSGYAFVGYGDRGIEGYGWNAGGYFQDTDHSGYASVGYGNRGIEAYGNEAGGYFGDLDHSGYAYVGYGNAGIEAFGGMTGGYFEDTSDSGVARVGVGDYGIRAFGEDAGGYFKDSNGTGYADVGVGNEGIRSYGSGAGGHFENISGTGRASIGLADTGINARGEYAGGYFYDSSSGVFMEAATGLSSTFGNGLKAFVQNHPYESDQVIMYAALEGDEVGTYTRGTARLSTGEARVSLGETFRWVTNPDIGLTAQVTPRGDWVDLYVESVTTAELIVRARDPGAPDVLFDYIVHGLRIGFEEVAVVREKTEEAYLPSMADQRELDERRPELRRYRALERFKTMRTDIGIEEPLELDASSALRNAIVEFDPAVHPESSVSDAEIDVDRPGTSADDSVETPGVAPHEARPGSEVESGRWTGREDVYAVSFRQTATDLASLVPVAEAVEAGELLVIDPDLSGLFRRSWRAHDATVIGIVAGDPEVILGSERASGQVVGRAPEAVVARVPVAWSGVVECKVDAGYGAIVPGDLLTTSPTAGHAMRAIDPGPGTIIGKALQSRDSGVGSIRVLVMLR